MAELRAGLPLDLEAESGLAHAARADGDVGAILVVRIEVDPAVEAEFNRWYDEEHIPQLTRVPGVRSGRRFVSRCPDRHYVAVYGLEEASVMKSQAWIEAGNTAWTVRMRGHFRDFAWDVYEGYRGPKENARC